MGAKVNKTIAKNKWIILIFVVALFLRIWKLDVYPEAIDEDEMSLGYISYALSKNGTDEHGNSWPIYFQSVGDYKYGLYSYVAMPFVYLFGLSTFITRLPAALFGALSVLSIYFLVTEVFKNKNLALFSALLLATNPTHIHFSRVAYSNIMGGFFTVVTLILFIRWIKKKDVKALLFTSLFFTLTIFSYQAYRVILPVSMFLISIVFTNKQNLKRILFINAIAFFVVLVSFIPVQSRARSQSILNLINAPALVENYSEDNLAGVSLLTTRIFHNKIVDFSLGFASRYLSYFDPRFLFLHTTNGVERHSTPNVGLLLLIELPLILYGLFTFSKFKDNRLLLIPLILIIVAPLGASLILEPTSTTRAVFLSYGMSILSGFGLYSIYVSVKKNNKIMFLIMAVVAVNLIYFWHQYTVHKVYHHPWYSDVGLKEMATSVMNNHINNYEKVVVSKGHYISFLFYGKSDPKEFINKEEIYSKLIFGMPYDCPAIGRKNTLYVCFDYKVPRAGRVIEVFRYRDSLPAIILVDFNERQMSPLPDRVEWGEDIPTYTLNENDYWPTNNSR